MEKILKDNRNLTNKQFTLVKTRLPIRFDFESTADSIRKHLPDSQGPRIFPESPGKITVKITGFQHLLITHKCDPIEIQIP